MSSLQLVILLKEIVMTIEQEQKVTTAIEALERLYYLRIEEPCNCGNQVLHNNGGNYHQIVEFRKGSQSHNAVPNHQKECPCKSDDNKGVWVRFYDTCELKPLPLYNYCPNYREVVEKFVDWLDCQ
jgi:hypothetical protein